MRLETVFTRLPGGAEFSNERLSQFDRLAVSSQGCHSEESGYMRSHETGGFPRRCCPNDVIARRWVVMMKL